MPVLLGQQAQISTQIWQGQFPSPASVEHYEKVLPGSFDRIIKMAEQAQEAQIEANRRAHEYTRNDMRRGHYLGFAAMGLAIGGAIWCVILGQPWVAGAFVTVPVMGVARSLIESAKTLPARDLADIGNSAVGSVAAPSQPAQPANPPAA
jgi:uncharacterized membrane protein